MNICASSRIKGLSGGVNTYSLIKSIAEEIRGLAVEFNVPIVSATQTTRSGYGSSDVGLEDTSESFGLPATADLMFALISNEELEGLNQILVKQLKNRYNDPGINKLKFSVESAAALVELLKRQRDAVGLSLFSDQIDLHTPARSNSAHHRMLFHNLEELVDSPPDLSKGTSAIDSLHEIAEATHRRSLIILFSDMLDNSENLEATIDALQHLRHNKHEVVVFHVLDRSTELDFDFENRPTRFVDLESGAELKLHPAEVKEHYINRMSEMRKELETRCGAHSIDFIDVDINEGPIPVLARYLIKRKKLF